MASRLLKVRHIVSQLPPLYINMKPNLTSLSKPLIGRTNQYYGFNNRKFPYPPFRNNYLEINGNKLDNKNEFCPENDKQNIEIIDWSQQVLYGGEGGSKDALWLVKFNEPGDYNLSIITELLPYSSIKPTPIETLEHQQYYFKIRDTMDLSCVS